MVTIPVMRKKNRLLRFVGAAFKRDDAGFTYLGMLFAVVVIGITLAVAGQVWSTASKRGKEEELIYRGNEIRKAIGRYYEESPGAKTYPRGIEDLIKDSRFPVIKRHLRRFYEDPFTGNQDWAFIKAVDSGVMGVKSRSEKEALKQANFPKELAAFNGKTKYNEWEFIYVPGPTAPQPLHGQRGLQPAPKK